MNVLLGGDGGGGGGGGGVCVCLLSICSRSFHKYCVISIGRVLLRSLVGGAVGGYWFCQL